MALVATERPALASRGGRSGQDQRALGVGGASLSRGCRARTPWRLAGRGGRVRGGAEAGAADGGSVRPAWLRARPAGTYGRSARAFPRSDAAVAAALRCALSPRSDALVDARAERSPSGVAAGRASCGPTMPRPSTTWASCCASSATRMRPCGISADRFASTRRLPRRTRSSASPSRRSAIWRGPRPPSAKPWPSIPHSRTPRTAWVSCRCIVATAMRPSRHSRRCSIATRATTLPGTISGPPSCTRATSPPRSRCFAI